MKRKLNKKIVIIVVVVLLVLLIEIINPIKLYNKHLLKELHYSEPSINNILKNGLKDDVLAMDYNEALNEVFKSKDFKKENFNVYKELEYRKLTDFTKQVNALISKGYTKEDVKNIIKSATDESLQEFLEKDYIEDVSSFLKYDFSILGNYDRYVDYLDKNNLDKELVVVYVNIGLDRDYYDTPNKVEKFSFDMLVNKYNELSKDFVPDNLIKVDEEYAVDDKQKGNETMLKNFIKMSNDCKSATGYKLLVRSGYRDYKSQEDTYNLYLNTYGKKYAENYVAHPGFSEHQTGLAVDVKAESSNTFAGTKESKWLRENAYKYGFIFRYANDTEEITGIKYESWHYRYVGLDIAKYIQENEMTYDEYYIRFLNNK